MALFLAAAMLITTAAGFWLIFAPEREMSANLDKQAELLESIETGSGGVIVGEVVAAYVTDFCDVPVKEPRETASDAFTTSSASSITAARLEADTWHMSVSETGKATETTSEQMLESTTEQTIEATETISEQIPESATEQTSEPEPAQAPISDSETPLLLETPETTEKADITGIGVLVIDKINLKLPVVDGVTEDHLKAAVGRVPETAINGETGNAVIAGHRSYTYGRYFNRLGEMENGDIIRYKPKGGETMSFEVFEITEIEPGDQIAFMQPKDKAVITLYTCTPIRKATHRLLVRAKKI
jgi:LPXTG-site transpeptidase (sortase) family protein